MHLAYLDAGSASAIVTAVVAGFAGIGVFFKSMGRKMTGPFGKKKATTPADAE